MFFDVMSPIVPLSLCYLTLLSRYLALCGQSRPISVCLFNELGHFMFSMICIFSSIQRLQKREPGLNAGALVSISHLMLGDGLRFSAQMCWASAVVFFNFSLRKECV